VSDDGGDPVVDLFFGLVVASAETVADSGCGSPEIVEGFLCRFRRGLGFPDLVVDG
jgi:hypothetical protein